MKKSKRTQIDSVEFWGQFAGLGENDCWETTLNLTKSGYGRIWRYPKMVYTHRVAWELANSSEIPEGMVICHKCDNPPCCNPKHLFLGTHLDNMRDSKNKGRNSHGPVLYGEQHPLSKLSESDVAEIRRICVPTPRIKSEFSITALASKYGVAKSLIHRIVTGQSWPHSTKDVILEAP